MRSTKRSSTLLAVVALAISTSALAAPFTGTIDIKVIAPQDSGGSARLHMGDAGVSTEVDMGALPNSSMATRMQTRTITKKNATSFLIIDDKSKSYREVALTAVRDSQRRPASETWHVKKIGAENVAGFPAQHVVATSSKGMVLELWTTKAIGDDEAFTSAWIDQAKIPTSLMDALERNDVGGIPAKLMTRTPAGVVGMEIVAVKKGPPPRTLFEVPAGYARLEDPAPPRGPAPPTKSQTVDGKLTL